MLGWALGSYGLFFSIDSNEHKNEQKVKKETKGSLPALQVYYLGVDKKREENKKLNF